MSAHHHREYALTLMCRVLSVPRSTFYGWQRRDPSPRAVEDHRLSRRRTGRLMREGDHEALRSRKWQVTTKSDPQQTAAPNPLDRQFHIAAPNRVWATDVTYCWTREGWLYLSVVMDLCSRRVVGWAASDRIDEELALEAWRPAVALRQPAPGLLHHSDRGSIYGSKAYRQALAARGAVVSMSGKGDCWDNAVVESFFATLKRGLVHRRQLGRPAEADAGPGDGQVALQLAGGDPVVDAAPTDVELPGNGGLRQATVQQVFE